MFHRPLGLMLCLLAVAVDAPAVAENAPEPRAGTPADVVVIGAGLAGLSAALEAGRAGARVDVVEMSSVFGGHAVMSAADVTMVDTPLQRARGIADSPQLAFEDFIRWGHDNDTAWVRRYVEHSRGDLYDWLTSLGVEFTDLRRYPGSRVPRAHETRGRGLGLVAPVYRACLALPNVRFHWNEAATRLVTARGRVTGLVARSTRTGEERRYESRAVVIATGGFQSNLALVRANWPKGSPAPQRLLVGSGLNSLGSGLELARAAGAAIRHLDHQWNYQRGLPDPRYPGSERGLNASVAGSVWVNAQGRRFVNEDESSPVTLAAVLAQSPATYWAIFDEAGRGRFWVSGTGWTPRTIEQRIFGDPSLVTRATTIAELAERTGLPAATLEATLAAYNASVRAGEDADFHRFTRTDPAAAAPIDQPPYYAVRFYPLTRKSMGGIVIDLDARALDGRGRPIAGLYAAGEAAGLAGINGEAALEGTFLGPSVLTGRVAAQSILRRLARRDRPPPAATAAAPRADAEREPAAPCTQCHDLARLTATQRPGYWHFERVHLAVQEERRDCATCHGELAGPFDARTHRIDRVHQIETCGTCHSGRE
ncbi:MAG: FAD-binding protein [Proteobacteria bacterium]|nr:FAD-binding protein [Pseudomonadota bacterium]